MSMSHASPLGKLRIVILICCLILALGILGCSLFNNFYSKVLDKEDITANVEKHSEDDLNYQFVSSYLKKFGIGNINTYKIDEAESKLRRNFYRTLPDKKEMAEAVTSLFIEYFYDEIDLEDKEAVTDAVLHCMIAVTEDRYAFYRTAEEYLEYSNSLDGGQEFVGIGVQVSLETLEISMVFPESGAQEAGIKSRDIIWGVGDKTQENTEKEDLVEMLKGEAGSTVNVTVKRGEEFLTFTVTRKVLKERTVYYKSLDNGVGYIQLTQFLGTTAAEFKEAVDFFTANGAKGLVVDVRYNPGGLLSSVVDVIDYLTPDAPERRIGSYTMNRGEQVYYTKDGHSVDLPIAVICNESTGSAAELFTAAMRDYRNDGILNTVIVGENTYGKGIAQSSFLLYDYSGLTFTIGYFNPPCNVNFNGVGVAPDVEVEEVHSVDAPLNTAISELLKLADPAPAAYMSADLAA